METIEGGWGEEVQRIKELFDGNEDDVKEGGVKGNDDKNDDEGGDVFNDLIRALEFHEG